MDLDSILDFFEDLTRIFKILENLERAWQDLGKTFKMSNAGYTHVQFHFLKNWDIIP